MKHNPYNPDDFNLPEDGEEYTLPDELRERIELGIREAEEGTRIIHYVTELIANASRKFHMHSVEFLDALGDSPAGFYDIEYDVKFAAYYAARALWNRYLKVSLDDGLTTEQSALLSLLRVMFLAGYKACHDEIEKKAPFSGGEDLGNVPADY